MSTLWFKAPPSITLEEMCGDLPLDDTLFEATTAVEVSQMAATVVITEPKVRSLKDLNQLFLRDDWTGSDRTSLSSITSEQMIALMFGKFRMPSAI
jgi:hypothetical protein